MTHDEARAAFEKWSRSSTGWSQTRLADEIPTNRSHLNQVLNGKRSGGTTWKRIIKILPMDGLLLLQQCSAWNKIAEAALRRRLEAERDAAKLLEIAARCRGEEVHA